MKDADGDPILMLNIFAQNLKLHLASWNVQGDKTNEEERTLRAVREQCNADTASTARILGWNT